MFAKTTRSVSMILGVALLAGAAFQAPAFAAESTLVHNERAAQAAIAGDTESRASAPVASSSPNLARSEAQARAAIFDASAPAAHQGATIGEATLTHNEIAAQRAIVDATTSEGFVRYEGTAATRVAAMRSPTTR
jgi:hypothetical protein